MKKWSLSFLFLLLACQQGITAQEFCYRDMTIKSNILTFLNISVETPIGGRFSGEAGYRFFSGISSWEIPSVRSQRLNIKYHFPFDLGERHIPSLYIYSGVNLLQKHSVFYETEKNLVYVGDLNVVNIPIGLGLKTRYMNFWIAYERTVASRENIYRTYRSGINGTLISQKTWLHECFSAGIAISFINIQVPRKKDSADPFME